ncbi:MULTISPECIES: ROK family protein [Streptomyces]|uniref:ROK family protein n=1 Tax=Streptomyces bacillaris TaxID=68179 RepID=A0ABW6DTF4_9ACTN|nr:MULTISPECIES: ROK family protein [Streptomyces]QCW79469.1 ROK family protein [Streptomyces sp. S6]MBT3075486.1 ROK family protein [Streptomyces sp. COG21]MBT3080000.1 ROK family protein [Streptomyces sp. COG20]MBT3089311.1 ROK family protein [Streptomyces sp. CYG21]MBT3098767.1 ROK family protein [Streptomyces sp. CBG30]
MSGPGPVTVLDVGGTHVRSATWSPDDGLSTTTRQPSPSKLRHPDATVDELKERLVATICAAVPLTPGAVAGVSFGAALDHRDGTVYGSAPLFGDETTPLDLRGALSRRRPDVRWHIVNDVTAALLHLVTAPHRHHHRKVLLMTVSSGIACRVIDLRNGTIATDACGLQGEVGHLPASARLAGQPVELLCDCGRPGHVSSYASGPGLRRMADVLRAREPGRWDRSRLGKGMADGLGFEQALAEALDEADDLAGELLDAATEPVAGVLRTALCLDPELDELALSGGVATGLAEHYRASVLGHLRREGLYLTGEREPGWTSDRITVCAPGEANGLIGAGIAALGGTHRGGPGHPAVVREGDATHLRRRPTVPPGPGEISVAPLVAGVCGTDLQILRGLRDDGAPVLGHEGVARIVDVGPGVADPRLVPGAHVVVNPTHPTDPSFLLGHNVDGMLQARMLVPASAVGGGLVLPLDEVPQGNLAVLIEPLAVVRYAALALREHRPDTLLVVGDGTVGHLAVRTARRWLGPAVRTVHVHHTDQGLEWSAHTPHRADRPIGLADLAAGEPAGMLGRGRVAVLIATPAPATLPGLELALRATEGADVAVDLVGGLRGPALSPFFPGVDLARTRAANCGGEPRPPVVERLTTADGRQVSVLGHRGVANEHLVYAAAELCRDPESFRDLVTHETDLAGAAEILTALGRSERRTVAGRRLVKLAVRTAVPS